MYVAVGLGVLTKGPVAIALPALAFGLYLLVRGELRRITTIMIPSASSSSRRSSCRGTSRSTANTGGPTSRRS